MAFLNQIEPFEAILPKLYQDPNEPVRMECERLIHAAVINRRFLNGLLTNPIKTIDDGFCGEKFAFTREEKQRIKHIRARNLADFSNQLMQVVEYSTCIPAVTEMAFAR
jgi:ribosomal protein S2